MKSISAKTGDFEIWFETRGGSSNDAIMLLHGFTGSHSTWANLCDSLEDSHFVIMPDLPGHGMSGTSSNLEHVNIGSTSDNLQRVLNHLGVRKTALLGYSMGGRVALSLALEHQDKVTSLILESASPGIRDWRERRIRKKEDDALAMDIEKRGLEWFVNRWESMPLFATQKKLDPSIVKRIREERFSNSANGLSMSLRAVGTGAMESLWERLGSLRTPVLLIVGELDGKFLAAGKAMQKLLPNCRLEEVKGAGHCTHVEKPDAFERIVEEFLLSTSIG